MSFKRAGGAPPGIVDEIDVGVAGADMFLGSSAVDSGETPVRPRAGGEHRRVQVPQVPDGQLLARTATSVHDDRLLLSMLIPGKKQRSQGHSATRGRLGCSGSPEEVALNEAGRRRRHGLRTGRVGVRQLPDEADHPFPDGGHRVSL